MEQRIKRAGALSPQSVNELRRLSRKMGWGGPTREDVWHLIDTVDARDERIRELEARLAGEEPYENEEQWYRRVHRNENGDAFLVETTRILSTWDRWIDELPEPPPDTTIELYAAGVYWNNNLAPMLRRIAERKSGGS